MYTQSSCSERNSGTPLTQADINRQNLRMNRIVQPMLDGNSDMGALIVSLTPPAPANTCDDFKNSNSLGPAFPWPLPGWNGGQRESAATVAAAAAQMSASIAAGNDSLIAGVTSPATTPANSTPAPGAAPTPAGAPSTVPAAGAGWVRSRGPRGAMFGRGGNGSGGRLVTSGSSYFLHGGIVEQIQQAVRNFNCGPGAKTAGPAVIPVPTVLTPSSGVGPPTVPAPSGAPAPSGGACPPQSACMTGNICLDLKRGCVSSSQLTSDQLLACAEAGYTGMENYFPCVIANLPNPAPQFGTPLPNPPPYPSVMAQDVPPTSGNWGGLAGLGCGDGPGTLTGVIGIALGVAAGLFFADWLSKERMGS